MRRETERIRRERLQKNTRITIIIKRGHEEMASGKLGGAPFSALGYLEGWDWAGRSGKKIQ